MVNQGYQPPIDPIIRISYIVPDAGRLLRMGIRLMEACSTGGTDVWAGYPRIPHELSTSRHNSDIPLLNLIGDSFQIRNDLMNLQSTEVRYLRRTPSTNPLVS